MRFLSDERGIKEVLEKLNIKYEVVSCVERDGLVCRHTENSEFYMEKDEKVGRTEFFVVEVDDKGVWDLDKFLSPIEYRKEFESDLVEDISLDIFRYVRRKKTASGLAIPIEDMVRNLGIERQLDRADVYLLIPGKISKKENSWSAIPSVESEFFQGFQENIDECIRSEYSSEFATKIERKCVAEVILQIEDQVDHNVYRQKAVVAMVKHSTGFCVMEIMVPNCSIGGNKLLNYYCGNFLKVLYKGKEYTIEKFCEYLNVRRFGKKRSMVFTAFEVEKEHIINALANEEYPMGKMGGIFEEIVDKQNIAQYDTAEVYVSNETMLEKCKKVNNISEERLAYNAIEIFFVELILFQDAAIDKIYQDLNREEEQQRADSDVKIAMERYEQLSFDMAQALQFGNYEQFIFPSTRESARNVAKAFGVDYIFEKYETNRELLVSMIKANKRRTEEQQDRVKNQFLLLLSALATVDTVGGIAYSVYSDARGTSIAYLSSVGIVVVGYGVYLLLGRISEVIYKRNTVKKGRNGKR